MKSSGATQESMQKAAPGRPSEIEEASNRYLVHPVSRALVDRLIRTPVTPNQVSVSSVAMAAAGAACYLWLAWPWGPLAGLLCFFGWHVLDGADGDLARRSGRASTTGELVDGICDHLSQVLLYVALAIIVQRSLGGWAWAWASTAGASHFVQANAYETGRKTYRRWVYGAGWMRQNLTAEASGGVQKGLGGLYLAVSKLFSPGEEAVEAAMTPRLIAGGEAANQARGLYTALHAKLVSRSAILSGNTRTMLSFLALFAGHPLWFFLIEITLLNLAVVAVTLARAQANRALVSELGEA